MSQLVQVVLAETVTDAEEIQAILSEAGIDAELEPAVEHHPSETDDTPQKVLVDASKLEEALAAIESMSEPDELVGD
jgi:type III secretory pathway lipoprotein EscJ